GRWMQVDPSGYNRFGADLYIAFANNPFLFLDPSGLEPSKPQDHHWFPRFGKTGQGEVNKICCKDVKINIDDFTTRLYDSQRGSPHYLLTFGDPTFRKYEDRVREIYASARNCCDLLKKMAVLILSTYAELVIRFWDPAPWENMQSPFGYTIGPYATFEMHHWG